MPKETESRGGKPTKEVQFTRQEVAKVESVEPQTQVMENFNQLEGREGGEKKGNNEVYWQM